MAMFSILMNVPSKFFKKFKIVYIYLVKKVIILFTNRLAEIPKAFLIGPGAGSKAIIGKNW